LSRLVLCIFRDCCKGCCRDLSRSETNSLRHIGRWAGTPWCHRLPCRYRVWCKKRRLLRGLMVRIMFTVRTVGCFCGHLVQEEATSTRGVAGYGGGGGGRGYHPPQILPLFGILTTIVFLIQEATMVKKRRKKQEVVDANSLVEQWEELTGAQKGDAGIPQHLKRQIRRLERELETSQGQLEQIQGKLAEWQQRLAQAQSELEEAVAQGSGSSTELAAAVVEAEAGIRVFGERVRKAQQAVQEAQGELLNIRVQAAREQATQMIQKTRKLDEVIDREVLEFVKTRYSQRLEAIEAAQQAVEKHNRLAGAVGRQPLHFRDWLAGQDIIEWVEGLLRQAVAEGRL